MSTSNDTILRVINETRRSSAYLVKRNGIEVIRKDLKVANVNIDQINQEMNMLKNLRDRSVVIYKESFYDQKSGLYHIYMEYFEDGDLYSQIAQCIQENRDFKEECMCSSLKYIHSSCIIHRNMKPQNIYIDDSNIFVLGDFGICMMSDLKESKLIGTENYIAPELWDKDCPIYTPATDIFAFGCILYEIYTLRQLYPGRDINEIRNRTFDNKVPSFKRHNEERIPQIEILITKMIEKNPLSRISLESIDKQFNPWVNVMNSSVSSSMPLPTEEYNYNNDNSKKDDNNIILLPGSIKQQLQNTHSSSEDSIECTVFQISRNKSLLSKSDIKRSSGQIDDFDDDEEDETPVNSFLKKSSLYNSSNSNDTVVKRSKRVGALYLSLGSLSGEKIVQFYMNERDLNGKLISDYLSMNQKEIDDFDFTEYIPFYFPLLNQETPSFTSNEKEKFNNEELIKIHYNEMIELVLRKYGEVSNNCSHFYAKENWKESKELEDVLMHILNSIKSIYNDYENNNCYKVIDGYFNENHIVFVCGVNDDENILNGSEEIDSYTGEKRNSLTVIDFYMNVIPVAGYKISDICDFKQSINTEFPLQHFISWLFPELYQQNPRFDPFDKASMKCVKNEWINYSYRIMNRILKENNINFDYNRKQIQIIGKYKLSDELKLYIVRMAEFLRMMSEDENASALEEFLCNSSNARIVGLVQPIHPSQIDNQPPPLQQHPHQPQQPFNENKPLPPLPANRLAPIPSPPYPPPPPPPPQQPSIPPHLQHNHNISSNYKPLPPIPPQSFNPQPMSFNPPPKPISYSDVVKFYLGEITLENFDIDYFLHSPLELLVDFNFMDNINYFTPVLNQKYPPFNENDINIMRRSDIKQKYEIINQKIMERYNFVVNENGVYQMLKQDQIMKQIENNKDIKDMLYQMRMSVIEIYNDKKTIDIIEYCLGINNDKRKRKDSVGCIIQ